MQSLARDAIGRDMPWGKPCPPTRGWDLAATTAPSHRLAEQPLRTARPSPPSKRSKSWRCTWTCTRSTGGVTVDDVAKAHAGDLEIQDSHGVKYLRYWVDESNGKIFCLVDAPDADAANTVHREAHGLVADEIYSVTEGA